MMPTASAASTNAQKSSRAARRTTGLVQVGIGSAAGPTSGTGRRVPGAPVAVPEPAGSVGTAASPSIGPVVIGGPYSVPVGASSESSRALGRACPRLPITSATALTR